MIIIYFLITFFATLFGSMTGAAGGVIIKPFMDLVREFDAVTIGVLTGITLITMSFVNIISHILRKTDVSFLASVLIILGSTIGGIIGGNIIFFVDEFILEDSTIKIIQNFLLILFMLASIYLVRSNKRIGINIYEKRYLLIVMGMFLGMTSTFLGIGGGPINVTFLIIFFSFTAKESAIYSIIIVLSSQLSKMITLFTTTNADDINLSVLPYMMIAGVVGGYLGAKLNKKFNENIIVFVFNAIQIIVIFTCCINIFNYI